MMDYFPPKDVLGDWGTGSRHKDFRGGHYRNWYMQVTKKNNGTFSASVWISGEYRSVHPKVAFNEKHFTTERDACLWCVNKVDSRYTTRTIVETYCIDYYHPWCVERETQNATQ